MAGFKYLYKMSDNVWIDIWILPFDLCDFFSLSRLYVMDIISRENNANLLLCFVL